MTVTSTTDSTNQHREQVHYAKHMVTLDRRSYKSVTAQGPSVNTLSQRLQKRLQKASTRVAYQNAIRNDDKEGGRKQGRVSGTATARLDTSLNSRSKEHQQTLPQRAEVIEEDEYLLPSPYTHEKASPTTRFYPPSCHSFSHHHRHHNNEMNHYTTRLLDQSFEACSLKAFMEYSDIMSPLGQTDGLSNPRVVVANTHANRQSLVPPQRASLIPSTKHSTQPSQASRASVIKLSKTEAAARRRLKGDDFIVPIVHHDPITSIQAKHNFEQEQRDLVQSDTRIKNILSKIQRNSLDDYGGLALGRTMTPAHPILGGRQPPPKRQPAPTTIRTDLARSHFNSSRRITISERDPKNKRSVRPTLLTKPVPPPSNPPSERYPELEEIKQKWLACQKEKLMSVLRESVSPNPEIRDNDEKVKLESAPSDDLFTSVPAVTDSFNAFMRKIEPMLEKMAQDINQVQQRLSEAKPEVLSAVHGMVLPLDVDAKTTDDMAIIQISAADSPISINTAVDESSSSQVPATEDGENASLIYVQNDKKIPLLDKSQVAMNLSQWLGRPLSSRIVTDVRRDLAHMKGTVHQTVGRIQYSVILERMAQELVDGLVEREVGRFADVLDELVEAVVVQELE